MPIGGVMALGHNFDSEKSFADSLARGIEQINGQTWRPLRPLFERAGIPMERCCFTNAFMGLMAGSKATGSFPGARDPDFVRRCQAFLLEQIRMQQPQLILTLGIHVPKVLAPLAPDLMPLWNRRTTFRSFGQPVNCARLFRPLSWRESVSDRCRPDAPLPAFTEKEPESLCFEAGDEWLPRLTTS